MAAKQTDNRKVAAENRRARYEFAIGDIYEAGIALTGTEVKSLRTGKATIAESYVGVSKAGVVQLINAFGGKEAFEKAVHDMQDALYQDMA